MERNVNSGFTLIEIIVSMVILGFAGLLIGLVLTTSSKLHRNSFSTEEAYSIAKDKLGQLQNSDAVVLISGNENEYRENTKYIVSWEIDNNNNPLRADITVTWNHSGKNRNISISGYIEASVCVGADPNYPPTNITLSSLVVGVGALIGTEIGTFSTDDANSGDVHFYTLVDDENGSQDADNDKFIIEEDILIVNDDIEERDYSIYVRSTDCGDSSVDVALTISAEDILLFYDQSFNVDEMANNTTVVGEMIASPSSVTFSIISQTVSGTFSLSPSGDKRIVVADNTHLDYEANSVIILDVKADDGNGDIANAKITIILNNKNDAPVLVSNVVVSLSPVQENETPIVGDDIASIVQETISDQDGGAVEGIAIKSLDARDCGTWEYSIDGGSWNDMGVVSTGTALLLRSVDKIRFSPTAIPENDPNFTYHAWDQTFGTYGSKVNISPTGDTTAFSIVNNTATIKVTEENTAPVLVPHTPKLPDIIENETDPSGAFIHFLMGLSITDVDADDDSGIAIYDVKHENGEWQYNTGGGWTQMLVPQIDHALLLKSINTIRFVPNGTIPSTKPYVLYYGWDQTKGIAGNYFDMSNYSRGGNSALSIANDKAEITVKSSVPDPCDGVADWITGTGYPQGVKVTYDGFCWTCIIYSYNSYPGQWGGYWVKGDECVN